MNITEEKIQDIIFCKVEGEININTSPQLRKSFEDLIKSGSKKIIIDFSSVLYIDSSGLATLIELFQRLKKTDGKLRICNMSERVRNVFEVTKLHKLFEIYDNRDLALEGF